jgi:hypothetical protein
VAPKDLKFRSKYDSLYANYTPTLACLWYLVNGVTKTRYEHAGLEIPGFVKYLRTFGEKQEL